MKAQLHTAQKEDKAIRIEYTKQVRENEATVKRYRQLIEDEKQFAISKFAKDLLDVRDAMRLALENTSKTAATEEQEIEILREKFISNIEGQEMTADIMDNCMRRFNLEQYDPKGQKFDAKLHEAVFTIAPEQAEGLEVDHCAVVMQTGWKIGDRILRAAKVGIVKGKK